MARSNGGIIGKTNKASFGKCVQTVITSDGCHTTQSGTRVVKTAIIAGGGAGIATAQEIADKGIEVVLTGNCGPNAFQVLSAAGIKVVTGVSGKVRDTAQDYKAGSLQPTSHPNVPGHFGMGTGRGMGRR